jgi:hypothetical protein
MFQAVESPREPEVRTALDYMDAVIVGEVEIQDSSGRCGDNGCDVR